MWPLSWCSALPIFQETEFKHWWNRERAQRREAPDPRKGRVVRFKDQVGYSDYI